MMLQYRFKTLFGFISLRSGSIAIGTFSLLWMLGCAATMGSQLGSLQSYQEHFVDAEMKDSLIYMKLILTVIMVYLIVVSIFSAVMIDGAAKGISRQMFPWLAVNFWALIWCFTVLFGFLIFNTFIESLPLYFMDMSVLLAATLIVCLKGYLWKVVYSHYMQIIDAENGAKPPPYDNKIIVEKEANPYRTV